MKAQNPSTSLGEGRDVAPSLALPSQKQNLVVYTKELTHLEPTRHSLLPFLFFAEHRLDIVQTLAICRSSSFNGGGISYCTEHSHHSLPIFGTLAFTRCLHT
jgi:hypothetical protein